MGILQNFSIKIKLFAGLFLIVIIFLSLLFWQFSALDKIDKNEKVIQSTNLAHLKLKELSAINLHDFMSLRLFMNLAFDPLHYFDLIPATVKTFFFGFAIGLIGCYKGYYSEMGTEGVGKAANSAVVISSLVIFIIDLIAVQLADLSSIFFI